MSALKFNIRPKKCIIDRCLISATDSELWSIFFYFSLQHRNGSSANANNSFEAHFDQVCGLWMALCGKCLMLVPDLEPLTKAMLIKLPAFRDYNLR